MTQQINVLLITGGHIFEYQPFFQMIEALQQPTPEVSLNWTHVQQPEAEALLMSERTEGVDVLVFYDMPGVTFTGRHPPFAHYDPSERYKANFLRLLDHGKGMVFLHHAIAAWPSWPEFAEILGGRFHFLPGELDGTAYPGSGYRFRTPQTIEVIDPNHPITQGLAPSFSIVDETYLFPVLEDQVTPLLRSDFQFTADQFRMGGVGFKTHPQGSNLVGWTKRARNSDIAYLQLGHGPQIYSDANFRTLLTNSIKWAALSSHTFNVQNAILTQ